MANKKIKKYLIVGLGNPGEEYNRTRHNFGFEVLDYFLAEKNKSDQVDFLLEFYEEPKFKSLFCLFNLGDKKIILSKPQTFMNLSGQAVQKIIAYYGVDPENILVAHDDIDIVVGSIKISNNAGSAGHRGVESIIKELKNKNFTRLRLGIRDEDFLLKTNMPTKKFVLEKFNQEEENKLIKVLENSVEVINCFIENGFSQTVEKYNQIKAS